MSDYPALFKDYGEYINLINGIQGKDPVSLAASYWLRWYWVKSCGSVWQRTNQSDQQVALQGFIVISRLRTICQHRLILFLRLSQRIRLWLRNQERICF